MFPRPELFANGKEDIVNYADDIREALINKDGIVSDDYKTDFKNCMKDMINSETVKFIYQRHGSVVSDDVSNLSRADSVRDGLKRSAWFKKQKSETHSPRRDDPFTSPRGN